MNREFVEKMIEAKKLEKEAFSMLLPEPARGHMDVISGEIRAMLKDCVMEIVFEGMKKGSKAEKRDGGSTGENFAHKETASKVKKVTIG